MKHQWTYERFGWTDLTPSQKKLFESIELDMMPMAREMRRITEAEMSADQISKTFKGSEEISRDKGYRTTFGKAANLPKDTLLSTNRILANFGKKLQDSGPVKAIDEKVAKIQEVLRQKLEKSPKGQQLLRMVDGLGTAARNNPRWQSAILGILTAISGLALGPAAIPPTIFLLKGVTEMLKGEKFSTAMGKGLYAAALGYIGAQVAGALAGYFENLRIQSLGTVGPRDLGYETISFRGSSVNTVDGMQWTRSFRIANVTVDPETRRLITDAIADVGAGRINAYDQLLSIARRVASPEYATELSQRLGRATAERISNDGFLSSIRQMKDLVVAAAGGAGAAAADAKKKTDTAESIRLPLPVMEGLWADLTLKFGAGKLMKAWTQAGKPTDSVEVARLMSDMGMEADDIRAAMVSAGLSDADVSDTMKKLSSGEFDDDVEVPFVSGFSAFDDEARRIFKSKGKDEFIKYWEGKLTDLEKSAEEKPSTDSGTTARSDKTDWPSLRGEIGMALKNKQINRARELMKTLTDVTGPQKDIILTTINGSKLDQNSKMQLRRILSQASIAETEMFEDLAAMLREHKLTIKDLGYQMVIRERRTDSVIMI